MYINSLTLRKIIQSDYSYSIDFSKFDKKTLERFCYVFLEEYRRLYIISKKN